MLSQSRRPKVLPLLPHFSQRTNPSLIGVLCTRNLLELSSEGYTVLSVYLIAIPMLHKNDLMVSFVIGGLFAMLGRLLSVYLAMVWTVGVMVSVAEESCYGLEALWRGGEIVKGRRIQGFLIALMLLLAEGVFTGGGITEAKNAAGFILIIFLVLTKMFSYMIYSVFYCECRKEVCSTRVVVANNGEILP